ncbi:MAG: hypothetical protein U1F56_07765 [Rubrivivax sp.]
MHETPNPTPLTVAPRRLVLHTSSARLIATLYQRANPAERVRLLAHLLRPVGPLALAAIAAGAFARLLPRERWTGAQLSLEDTQRFDAWQIAELVRYVQQKNPEWLLQLPQGVGDPRLWLGGAAGALLLLLLRPRRGRG